MAKTITDKWPIRYMRLDDEVYGAVMELKEKYGSPNKGLRAVLLDQENFAEGPSTVSVGPALSDGEILDRYTNER